MHAVTTHLSCTHNPGFGLVTALAWDSGVPVPGLCAASRRSGDHSATLGADVHSYMVSSEVLDRMRSNFQFG